MAKLEVHRPNKTGNIKEENINLTLLLVVVIVEENLR